MRFFHENMDHRPRYDMHYATQLMRWSHDDKQLNLLASCRAVTSRWGYLDGTNLSVELTSPMENVIRVKLIHFEGARSKEPHFTVNESPVTPVFTEDESGVSITSGLLTATAKKGTGAWKIDFTAEGKTVTASADQAFAYAIDTETDRRYMVENLCLDVGELVYGLGEHFGPFVKNGQSVDIWNADCGTSTDGAYKNVPFYMTNRGYGVFVESTGDVRFEVASEKVERVEFSMEGESLTYDIIYGGTPKKVLDLYTALTGRPPLLPEWSYGLWLSTSFTTNYDEKTASSFIDGMAERKIPLSVFHFDCFWMKGFNWCDFTWDSDVFPDPVGMLKRYHEKGLKLCCWINPYIGQASPLFREGMEGGYLVKKTNGDVWQSDMWQAGMGIVDFTNPAARDWYCGYLKKLMDMGIDCFKTDFGERIPVKDIVWHDGSDPLLMHNYYTYLYNKTVFELIKSVKGEGEAIVFARSATAGSQCFPVHWGGDNSASYVSMAETMRAGLSMMMSGFSYWSHDISGFGSTAPAHIYKRWCQFGLLSSHSRLHGAESYRVPWLFDEESCDVVRAFGILKNRLMPYLYAASVEAHEHGTPVLRPMVLEFPDDLTCETLDRQYMLGGNLLVAPVFKENGEVTVYLPEGKWTNLFTNEVVSGGCWRKEQHGFMTLPLYVKENTVLPMGASGEKPDYDYTDNVELHVYQLSENTPVTVTIPNSSGIPAATYTVTMRNGTPEVTTDSKKPYSVIVH